MLCVDLPALQSYVSDDVPVKGPTIGIQNWNATVAQGPAAPGPVSAFADQFAALRNRITGQAAQSPGPGSPAGQFLVASLQSCP